MKWIERFRHHFVCLWRFMNGRWFVLRDRPDWYVLEIASYDKDSNPKILGFIEAAEQEMENRINAIRRKVEYAIRKAPHDPL